MSFDTFAVMEYVGPEKRTIVGNVPLAVFLTLGAASLPWIAYGLADWRLFSIITSAPIALTVVAWWIVPESARWLVLKGKIDETVETLKECARVNGKIVDPAIYDEFKVKLRLFFSLTLSNQISGFIPRMTQRAKIYFQLVSPK